MGLRKSGQRRRRMVKVSRGAVNRVPRGIPPPRPDFREQRRRPPHVQAVAQSKGGRSVTGPKAIAAPEDGATQGFTVIAKDHETAPLGARLFHFRIGVKTIMGIRIDLAGVPGTPARRPQAQGGG